LNYKKNHIAFPESPENFKEFNIIDVAQEFNHSLIESHEFIAKYDMYINVIKMLRILCLPTWLLETKKQYKLVYLVWRKPRQFS